MRSRSEIAQAPEERRSGTPRRHVEQGSLEKRGASPPPPTHTLINSSSPNTLRASGMPPKHMDSRNSAEEVNGVPAVSPRAMPPDDQATGDLSAESTSWRQHGYENLKLIPRGMSSCPACWSLTGAATLGIIAAIGLMHLPPEVGRGFDVLRESDVECAILLDAFEAAFDRNEVESGHLVFDIFVAYEVADAGSAHGLFQPSALQQIAKFEQQLRLLPGWQETCKQASHQHQVLCDPGLSFVNYALPSLNISRGQLLPNTLLPDGHGADMLPLSAVLHIIEHRGLTNLLLPSDFQPGKHGPESITGPATLRSGFRFRLPFTGKGEDTHTSMRKLKAEWKSLVSESLLPGMQAAAQDRPMLRIYFEGTSFEPAKYMQVIFKDTALAGGALAFTFAYLMVHLRSFLLAAVATGSVFLTLPLTFVFSALLAGSTHISAVCFLAAFLTIGLSAHTAVVFTDFWWDSAQHADSDEGRLIFTYTHAGKLTLTMSTAMAFSFVSHLVGMFRPLREFGVFMGVSMFVNWLVAAWVYLPLCLANERHCAACRLFGPGSADLASGEVYYVRTCDHVFTMATLRMRRWRCPLCIVPVLFGAAFAYMALWRIQLTLDVPTLVHEDHILNTGSELVERFVPVQDALGAWFQQPSRLEQVCGEQHWAESSNVAGESCSIYWCDAQSMHEASGNGSCTCFRRTRTDCGAASDVTAMQYLLGLRSLPDLNAVNEFLLSAGDTPGGQSVSVKAASGLAENPTVQRMPPLILQEWGADILSTPMVKVTTALRRTNLTSSSCGWDDVCFCGVTRHCRLQTSSWQLLPQSLYPLSLQAAPRMILEAGWRSPPEGHTVVHVVLGIGVKGMGSLLGAGDLASWDLLDGFDMSQTNAQLGLLRFCSQLPDALHVVERRCWIEDFQAFVLGRGEQFPVTPSRFGMLLLEFVQTGPSTLGHVDDAWPRIGIGSSSQYLLFRGGKLRACYVSMLVNIRSQEISTASEILEYQRKWDSHLEASTPEISTYMHGSFHCSDLWLQAEVQSAFVSSAILSGAVSLVLSFICTMVFTRNCALPLYGALASVGVMSGHAFFVVSVMDRPVGPVEILSLVVFVGYAFYGSLHITYQYCCSSTAFEYNDALNAEMLATKCDERSTVRAQRVAHALRTTGGALCGGGLAVGGTTFFLIFSHLAILRCLGSTLPVLVALSTLVALVPLPAGLLMCGPVAPGENHLASLLELSEEINELWGVMRSGLCGRCLRPSDLKHAPKRRDDSEPRPGNGIVEGSASSMSTEKRLGESTVMSSMPEEEFTGNLASPRLRPDYGNGSAPANATSL